MFSVNSLRPKAPGLKDGQTFHHNVTHTTYTYGIVAPQADDIIKNAALN